MKGINRIELSLNVFDEWQARFAGPHADTVIALFGTDVIPTPYTKYSTPETVQQAIADLNPGIDVVVIP